MDIKYKNYCIVVMGDTEGVTIEIEKVSDVINPNILNAKGILISTFISALNIKELNDFFDKRSFLLFELDDKTSGFNITKKDIHEGLFGFLKKINTIDKSTELLKIIDISLSAETTNNTHEVKRRVRPLRQQPPPIPPQKISEEDIAKMTKEDKNDFWNRIIDKGVENLSDYDKSLLQILSK